MKTNLSHFLLKQALLLVCLSFFLKLTAQVYDPNSFSYEIANYYRFKEGAVTFSFDDGVFNQFTIGKEIMESFGFKGTFFVVTSNVNWDTMNKMVNSGHEIGSHTVSHPKLSKLDLKVAQNEMLQSKCDIENNINHYTCFSLGYPHGDSNELIRYTASGIFYAARSSNPGFSNHEMASLFNIPSFGFSPKTKLNTSKKWINTAIHDNLWIIETYHGFDGEGYEPVSSKIFKKHLGFIKSKEHVIWVATFRDVVKYLKEKQNAKIEFLKVTNNSCQIKINDNLPDSIYNHPLTLKVRIPKSWTIISLENQGKKIEYQLNLDPLGNKSIIFDAIPDTGIISIISETLFDSEQENCNNCKIVAYPNPFNNYFYIAWDPLKSGRFSLINTQGKIVLKGDLKTGFRRINTESLDKGIYILLLDFNSEIQKQIMVKE